MKDKDERTEADKERRLAELRALMYDEAGREKLVAELLALEESLGVRIDDLQALEEIMDEVRAATDNVSKKLNALHRRVRRRQRARAVSVMVVSAYWWIAGVLVLIALGLAIVGLAQVVFQQAAK